MAEDSTTPRRRRRWVALAVLLGAGAWFVRSRRFVAPDLDHPWPVPRPAPPPFVEQRPGRPGPADLHQTPRSPAPAELAGEPAPPETERPVPQPLLAVGGVPPEPDGSAPGPEYTIKGNADSMLFHPPSSPYYTRTKAEVWFRTADEARAAGFTEWTPKKRAARPLG